ncbi:MAG: hypothetical protein V4722_24080 [Bacteroidota bacterium]
MKRTFFFLAGILLLSQMISAQTIDSTIKTETKTRYEMLIKKARQNRTIGWVLLGAGIVMTGTSAGVIAGGSYKGDGAVWISLLTVGGISTVASIPFFISAGSNKRKAKWSLKESRVSLGNKAYSYVSYPVIAYTISL